MRRTDRSRRGLIRMLIDESGFTNADLALGVAAIGLALAVAALVMNGGHF